ncbi:MAG: oligosaccharide flippase family protein [Nitrososphaerales archaeon]
MVDSSRKSEVGKGAYHLFVGNFLSTIILALATIIIGRLLGPDKYGLYTIALIVPSYSYLALRWGFSSTITRYAAKYLSEGNRREAISFSYSISVFHVVTGSLAIVLLIPFSNVISTDLLHRPSLSNSAIIPVVFLSVIGIIMYTNGSALFTGLSEFGKSAILQILMALIRLVISVFLILIGYSILAAVVGYAIGFMMSGAISLTLLIFMNKTIIPQKVKENVNISIKYALPVYSSIVLQSLVSPFQSTVLAFTVSNTQIGWFTSATNIAALIGLFTFPVSTSLFPLFSKTLQGGAKVLVNTYRKSVKYTALLVTPATMFVMATSVSLVHVLFGQSYLGGAGYLTAIALVNLLAGFGSHSWGPLLYGIGETDKAFRASAFGTGVSVIASLALVYYFGVYGVIIGATIGQVVSLVFGLRFVSEILETKLDVWIVLKIYVSSALSAGIVYFTSLFIANAYLSLVVSGILFVLILIPIMAITKSLDRSDINQLQEHFQDIAIINYFLKVAIRYYNFFSRI